MTSLSKLLFRQCLQQNIRQLAKSHNLNNIIVSRNITTRRIRSVLNKNTKETYNILTNTAKNVEKQLGVFIVDVSIIFGVYSLLSLPFITILYYIL